MGVDLNFTLLCVPNKHKKNSGVWKVLFGIQRLHKLGNMVNLNHRIQTAFGVGTCRSCKLYVGQFPDVQLLGPDFLDKEDLM